MAKQVIDQTGCSSTGFSLRDRSNRGNSARGATATQPVAMALRVLTRGDPPPHAPATAGEPTFPRERYQVVPPVGRDRVDLDSLSRSLWQVGHPRRPRGPGGGGGGHQTLGKGGAAHPRPRRRRPCPGPPP